MSLLTGLFCVLVSSSSTAGSSEVVGGRLHGDERSGGRGCCDPTDVGTDLTSVRTPRGGSQRYKK